MLIVGDIHHNLSKSDYSCSRSSTFSVWLAFAVLFSHRTTFVKGVGEDDCIEYDGEDDSEVQNTPKMGLYGGPNTRLSVLPANRIDCVNH